MTALHPDHERDVLVIGSGFGGVLAAHALLGAGLRVTMVERGNWVERGPDNWLPGSVGGLGPHFSTATGWRNQAGKPVGTYHCVGGPSVFYGGVSLRFRERDFAPCAEIDCDSGASWPLDYAALEPWYSRVESIIGVSGTAGADPTEPPRNQRYPLDSLPLADVSHRIAKAARALGMNPFPLPLAIQTTAAPGRAGCVACGSCDGFACAIAAKNDLATAVLPSLIAQGLDLRTNVAITRLETDGSRITAALGVDTRTGEPVRYTAAQVVLAAGALGTPHLLLASGLDALSPARNAVGRYLTRHRNEILLGIFPRKPDPARTFHKQLGIHDFYFGDPARPELGSRLGGIQQLPTPPIELARDGLPGPLKPLARFVDHLTGLLVIAEDRPRQQNGVRLASWQDELGMPGLDIAHSYDERDVRAADVLRRHATRILRKAGAWYCYRHLIDTFSHALGTVRMGTDAATAPLDADNRYRGLENLVITDGSALPRSAGVNPSLTIAALALRAGTRLAERINASSTVATERAHA